MRLDTVRDDLEYLIGPETAGRLSGSEGVARAVAYLARRLTEMGLSPAAGSVRLLVVVRDGQAVSTKVIRGAVVLIPERPEGFDFNATAAAVADLAADALQVEWGSPGGSTRPSLARRRTGFPWCGSARAWRRGG